MKILLAESDPNIRYGLNILSEQLADRVTMGEATDSQELLRGVCTACPDVLLISPLFPGMEGGELLTKLQQLCPQLIIIILSVNLAGKDLQLPELPTDRIKIAQNPKQLFNLLDKIHHAHQSKGGKNAQKAAPAA